ncbi:SUMF1/EgtB/PvdO family nonheme iron enzyme [Hydrocoleum sp. CS-953]|uniref:formylglycine-generating enzyme family protein n=1 Tax=Hydrocoleum sp. CS-953 TaxID=1671698 RepID=UPI000B9C4560
MHGNVSEWCADDWHDNYQGAPSDGSAWLENDQKEDNAVLRGGSWFNDPSDCRSAYREGFDRGLDCYNLIGFRVVCGAGITL